MAHFSIMWQGIPDMANWLSVDLCPPLCGVATRNQSGSEFKNLLPLYADNNKLSLVYQVIYTFFLILRALPPQIVYMHLFLYYKNTVP